MYQLVVETETVVLDSCFWDLENIGEVLIHRFYVEAQDPTDIMNAVFGNNEDPLVINAPGGVYNHPLNSTWNASGLNPLLFQVFNCLQYDSYATISLDGPASDVPGAEDPSLVQDSQLSPTISDFFMQNTLGEPVGLSVNTLTGASWYVLNTASNSLPDEDGRWLVMQLTSAAHVDGVLNFSIYGGGANAWFSITRPFNTAPLCTDPYACNYEPSAFNDQGICDYSCCPGPGCCGEGTTWDSESQTCLTTYLHDADFDGCVGMTDLLDLLSVFGSCQSNFTSYGCTMPLACNYDSTATVNDGSCLELDECGVCGGVGAVYECGCTDILEGECDCDGNVLDAFGECGGPCANDADGDGVCDDFYVAGCTIEWACNYNSDAVYNDNSCDYFSCLEFGCTVEIACNYEPEADYDDGSCEFETCAGCMLSGACNYDVQATIPGDCDYASCIECTTENVGEYFHCGGPCTNDFDNNGICDELQIYGCMNPSANNYDSEANVDAGTCFNYVLGCVLPFACNYDPSSTVYLPGSCDFSCLD